MHHLLHLFDFASLYLIPVGLIAFDQWAVRTASATRTEHATQPVEHERSISPRPEAFKSRIQGLPVWSQSKHRFV